MKSRGWPNNRTLFLFLLVTFFVAAFCRGVQIDTSFFSLFPEYSALSEVESKISHNTSSSVYIFAEGEDFNKAKQGAEVFCDAFRGTDIFRVLTLYQDPGSLEELKTYLFEHRYQLMDEETVASLEAGNSDQLSKYAFSQVYSPFSFADLSQLDKDPFLLTERSLRKYASQGIGNMFMKEGVLAAESGGKWYVMIRGAVTEKALSFSKKNGIGNVGRTLRNEINADTLASYQADNLLNFVNHGFRCIVEKHVSLVEEEDEFWQRHITHLRQGGVEFAHQPQKER